MNFREVLTAISQEAPSDEIAKQCVVQYLGLGTLQVIKTVVENHKTFVAPDERDSDGTIADNFLKLVGTIKSDNKGKMLISPRALCSMFGYSPMRIPWKPHTPPSVGVMFADGSLIIIEHPNSKEESPLFRRPITQGEASDTRYSIVQSGNTQETPTIR